MAALAALAKKANAQVADSSKKSVTSLYRSIRKELQNVLVLYKVHMPVKEASSVLKQHFRKNDWVKDKVVIGLLVSKGYMELEETLLQHKQKTHLMRILAPIEWEIEKKREDQKKLSATERYILGVSDEDY